jgi:hypothetical protein
MARIECRTAKDKFENRAVRGFRVGDLLTRPFRDARRFIFLYTIVARTHMYTHTATVWDFSIVQGPFPPAPCQTPFLRFATFSIAV